MAEFEAFFKSYIERFAFQSITTAVSWNRWMQAPAPAVVCGRSPTLSYGRCNPTQTNPLQDFTDMYKAAFPAAAKKVNWDAWLHSPGMPPVANKFDDTLVVRSHALADAWYVNRPTCVPRLGECACNRLYGLLCPG